MRIKQRIYEDYFKKSRLPHYREVLQLAKESGYKMVGVYEFFNIVQNDMLYKEEQKYLINRHDIDTSPKVARMMFDIEKEVYGQDGNATYYFRDSTINKALIKEIEEFGYETGYHYEEIATFEKKNKLKNTADIKKRFPEIEDMFLTDLNRFRKNTGSKCYSIASHGDFVNGKLSMQSYELLKNEELRKKANVYVEAYDTEVNAPISKRYADQVLLEKFPMYVTQGIQEGQPVIMMLTHPRNWKVDILANTIDNIGRFIQGVTYL